MAMKVTYKHLIGAAAICSSVSVSMSSMAAMLEPFRAAQLVKSESAQAPFIEIPLAKIARVGRGWEPEQVTRIAGEKTATLYKIDRNADLEEVIRHYQTQLTDYSILYQCEARACGSANAWANNFFGDYLLYGADGSQWLAAAQDNAGNYLTIYINRRGAGDVMVRLDEVLPEQNSVDDGIIAQMDVSDIPRIRRFLNDYPDRHLIAFVIGDRNTPESAIVSGDEHISKLRELLPLEAQSQVRFINSAQIAAERYGSNRVLFMFSPDN